MVVSYVERFGKKKKSMIIEIMPLSDLVVLVIYNSCTFYLNGVNKWFET